jgi:hypothetical protein
MLGRLLPSFLRTAASGLLIKNLSISCLDTGRKCLSSQSTLGRVIYATKALAYASSILELFSATFTEIWKQPVQESNPQEAQNILSETGSIPILQALEDLGFTARDFFILNHYFLSPDIEEKDTELDTLCKKIEFKLKERGLFYGEQLLLLGLSPGCSREEVASKLTKFLKNEKLPELQEKATCLPSIATEQRIAAIAFNLILTLGTVFLQLKIAPKAIAIGLGIGGFMALYIGHDLMPFSKLCSLVAAEKDENISKFLPYLKIGKISDYFLFFEPRKEKTALASPTTFYHKCRQVWESWNSMIVPTIISPTISVDQAMVQALTLASYYKSWNERTWTLFPKES